MRTAETNPSLHWIEFDVNRWERFCSYYERRCVQTDQFDRCVRYENVCVRWDERSTPVTKRIQIDLRRAPVLTGDRHETYQLQIQRRQPSFGQGEDDVRTWLNAMSTVQPVRVWRAGDYNYTIDVDAN